jgi:hypothetical protein
MKFLKRFFFRSTPNNTAIRTVGDYLKRYGTVTRSEIGPACGLGKTQVECALEWLRIVGAVRIEPVLTRTDAGPGCHAADSGTTPDRNSPVCSGCPFSTLCGPKPDTTPSPGPDTTGSRPKEAETALVRWLGR